MDASDRCQYTNKICLNRRTQKRDGTLHRLCEVHRDNAKRYQQRWHQNQQAAARRQRESTFSLASRKSDLTLPPTPSPQFRTLRSAPSLMLELQDLFVEDFDMDDQELSAMLNEVLLSPIEGHEMWMSPLMDDDMIDFGVNLWPTSKTLRSS